MSQKFFVRFQLLQAILSFVFIPWKLPMIKIMGVTFFRGLGLSKVMTSYLTESEFFLQNITFYIALERKFNADQLLIKDLGLNMYETEVMKSIFNKRLGVENIWN